MSRDVISITSLQLRTPSLATDLWHRHHRDQPLVLSLSIPTNVAAEADSDSLLSHSLNYGTVTRSIDACIDALDPAAEHELDELAERLAKAVLFHANAPACTLQLDRPRALLNAEAVGVEIHRERTDYSPSSPVESATFDPSDYTLRPAATSTLDDRLVIKALRRDIIIGVNQCEREEDQPVLVDLHLGVPSTEHDGEMLRFTGPTRKGWSDWRTALKAVESHLTASQPLTIEHITTSLASLLLAPPHSPTSALSPSWDISSATVKLSKPCALSFARYPSVQVTRQRSDFWSPDGSLLSSGQKRGITTSASTAESSSVASSSWEREDDAASTASTAGTEPLPAGGGLHTAFIAIGTNMGERPANLSKALKLLETLRPEDQTEGKTTVVDSSFLYESEAMYVLDQARFLNAVVKIETPLAPLPLLNHLKSIEALLGRQQAIRNGPRPIDLDILFYDDLTLHLSASEVGAEDRWLQIPHQSIVEREFVLRPLCDIAPLLQHPSLPCTPHTLLSTLLHSTSSTLTRVLPLSPSHTHPLGAETLLMSILNATPDSFSDGGGPASSPSSVPRLAGDHVAQGARILDVGGVSTRPGAGFVSVEEEMRRVGETIRAIRGSEMALSVEKEQEQGEGEGEGVGGSLLGMTTIPISVDTFRASVAREAVKEGATMVNDVLGGRGEGMWAALRELDVPVVLMHSRGGEEDPSGGSRHYEGGVVRGVRTEMEDMVREALARGVKRWNIVLDPGIGFAKTGEQNLELLRDLRIVMGRSQTPISTTLTLPIGSTSAHNADSHSSEEGDGHGFLAPFPLLVGLSRKKFLGTLTGKTDPQDRVFATAAGVTASVQGGADIVRVHDVEMARDVCKVADGIWRGVKA